MTWGTLMSRAHGICEFCGGMDDCLPVEVEGAGEMLVCAVCDSDPPVEHWRCLEEASRSDVPEVQVAVWRKLGAIDTPWAAEIRSRMTLLPEAQALV
ncbi:hypothetical protein ORIO_02495 [Cereibacter azotoformans]|uniref:PhnA protein n=1 Tax=Cereibacter sphaeroides (strain ATCC 17025 / ATH 2.4.3) TaxID=349102 RepID=A4WPT6_CERS5|nr:hypothetical protein [Cereibacter azotoformans]ULB08800.1 hypothetical protein ORIO_02495 [Cereibacter azotoformans]